MYQNVQQQQQQLQFPAKFLQCKATQARKWHVNEQLKEMFCDSCFDAMTDMVDTMSGFVTTKNKPPEFSQCQRDCALWVDHTRQLGIAIIERNDFKGFPVELVDVKQQQQEVQNGVAMPTETARANLAILPTAVQFAIAVRNLASPSKGHAGAVSLNWAQLNEHKLNFRHGGPNGVHPTGGYWLMPGDTYLIDGPFTFVSPSPREQQEQIAWEAQAQILLESFTLQWKFVSVKPQAPTVSSGRKPAIAPPTATAAAATILSPFARSDIQRSKQPVVGAAKPPQLHQQQQPPQEDTGEVFLDPSLPSQTVVLNLVCRQDDKTRYAANMRLWDARCQQRIENLTVQSQRLQSELAEFQSRVDQKNAQIQEVTRQLQQLQLSRDARNGVQQQQQQQQQQQHNHHLQQQTLVFPSLVPQQQQQENPHQESTTQESSPPAYHHPPAFAPTHGP